MDRLTSILLMLQEKPRTSEEIAGHFEVSKRTILRDIQALYEIGVPILSREGAGGGYTLLPGYRIESPPLSMEEAYLLLLALRAVSELQSAPFGDHRATLSTKMRALFSRQQLDYVDKMLSISKVEAKKRRQTAPFLEAIMLAATEQTWVLVTYQSAERTSPQHLLPKTVYANEGFWYCKAYSYERGEERLYRVDRMRSVEPARETFLKSAAPSLPYGHITHPQVRAMLTSRGVLHVETEPDIGGFIERNEDGSGSITFRCPPSELAYFARYFAGLGDEVEVIAPEELREAILHIAEKLAEKYRKQ
ncbi:MAG: WYL domain-containing protein [Chloroflexia bacterium]